MIYNILFHCLFTSDIPKFIFLNNAYQIILIFSIFSRNEMKFNYLNLLYSTFYSDLCSVHMYVCVVYVLCMYV